MIRKLKSWGARALFLLVVAAGLGFGVIAAAMGAVIGGLLLLGVRLAASAGPADAPPAPAEAAPAAAETAADGAQPA